jgi:Ser/Thr protein kinase RdoA (MazF antagonist)
MWIYRQLQAALRRPRLLRSTINLVLELYGLPSADQVHNLPGGNRSTSVALHTKNQYWLLKRYKASLAPSSIQHEHSVLRHLLDCGFLVPDLLTSRQETTYVEFQGSFYSLFEFVPGYCFTNYFMKPSTRLHHLAQAAHTLATLHKLTQQFTPEGYNPDGFTSHTGTRHRPSVPPLNQYSEVTAELRYLHQRLHKLEDELMAHDLPRTIIHGDYGAYNLIFQEGKLVAVVDFECSRLDWRLREVVAALYRFSRTRAKIMDTQIALYFFKEYEKFAPTAPIAIDLMPLMFEFVFLRNAILNWSRYLESGTQGRYSRARQSLMQAQWARNNTRLLSFSIR